MTDTTPPLFEDGRPIEALRPLADGARLSVIVAGRRAATVGADGAARLELREGAPWTAALGQAIEAENAFEKARRDAVRWLASKARSREEVRRRLSDKGHDSAAVERAVEHLTGVGALNDAKLAEDAARELLQERGLAARAALEKLAARGIESGLAACATGPAADRERALAMARERARQAQPGKELAEARRTLAALARKGFDEDIALEAVRTAFAEVGVRLDDPTGGAEV